METAAQGPFFGITYAFVAASFGIVCLLAFSMVIPKILNRFTPHIDEEKEILRGNRAIAEYLGRIVSALIIGISIIIAVSIYIGLN